MLRSWIDAILDALRPRRKRPTKPTPDVPPTPPPVDPPDRKDDWRQELLDLHNETRAPIDHLELDDRLNVTAQRHAEWMQQWSQMKHSGIPGIAENIAAGQRSPQEVWDSWRSSPKHYRNARNTAYDAAGFGRAGDYWCAMFATRWAGPT